MVRMTNNFDSFVRIFRRNVNTALKEIGKFSKSNLDKHAAVDTGFMKSKNKYTVHEFRVEVGNYGVKYNIYQEFGTYKMPAHPFVRPAAFNYRSQIRNIGITNLRRGLE